MKSIKSKTTISSPNLPPDDVKPSVKKYIVKLEAKISQLDDENSSLRIDNRRLERRVKLLESELSKHEPMSDEQLKIIEEAASDIAKKI